MPNMRTSYNFQSATTLPDLEGTEQLFHSYKLLKEVPKHQSLASVQGGETTLAEVQNKCTLHGRELHVFSCSTAKDAHKPKRGSIRKYFSPWSDSTSARDYCKEWGKLTTKEGKGSHESQELTGV